MDRDQLLASIVAARPGRDDTVYLERRGDVYDWRLVPPDGVITGSDSAGPDVWMSLTASWPVDDPSRMREFFYDLLAELESMADHQDRCRWPLERPWPHAH